eukprot:scaffold46424_cov38-Prasinocladus_malaysianus.AAC.1
MEWRKKKQHNMIASQQVMRQQSGDMIGPTSGSNVIGLTRRGLAEFVGSYHMGFPSVSYPSNEKPETTMQECATDQTK